METSIPYNKVHSDTDYESRYDNEFTAILKADLLQISSLIVAAFNASTVLGKKKCTSTCRK